MNNAGNWLGIDGGVYVLLQKAPPTIVRMSYPLMTMKKEYSRDEYVKRIRSMTVLHHELDYGIPFNDNTVPAVFSSHFLEHVGHREAQKLLGECFRVLKPGGIIRIVVPSLDTEVQRIRQALERYEAGEITDIQPFVTTNVVGYSNKYSNHRWMYNFTELRSALETAGFTQVVEQSYRKGRIPDVEKLDNRGGLLVEAIKP
jgi:predicted SAM-dependent methyltransferase